jgi:hypothetical protein
MGDMDKEFTQQCSVQMHYTVQAAERGSKTSYITCVLQQAKNNFFHKHFFFKFCFQLFFLATRYNIYKGLKNGTSALPWQEALENTGIILRWCLRINSDPV